MAADVSGDLSSAHGMADECDIVQIERVNQRCEIIGKGVVVVALAGLAGAAKAAARSWGMTR